MLSSRIFLAVAIPQTFLDGRVDPARLRRFLVRAEALGFSGAWVVEQVIGTVASLGPIECLTYAAAVTGADAAGRGGAADRSAEPDPHRQEPCPPSIS